MTDKITVLLVDDHTLLRAGLRALLSTEAGIEVVGEAGDGEEAITQARASIPDVVIMDISMPRLNGIDATRRLLAESPASKVIALSVHSSKRFVEDMLKAGAAGYLLKESVPEDMVAAIHAVMGGHGYLSPAIAGTVMSAYRDQVTKTQSTWAQSPRSEHSTQAAEDFDAGSALLQTKLHRPPLGQDLVPRLRLLENLEQGCTRALTLVSAPAGYGKSMLLSSWLETSKRLAAWVSLDEGESDLAQFIRYLVAGVRTLFSGAMQRTLALINAPNLPPMQVLEATLANELDGVEQPFIVVLDDYHRIRNQAVHDLLSALLCHPPRRLHLVLASRRDPPCPSPCYVSGIGSTRFVSQICVSAWRRRPTSSSGCNGGRLTPSPPRPGLRRPKAGSPGCVC